MIRARETGLTTLLSRIVGTPMIRARETGPFERYIGDLAIFIFLVAVNEVSPDSLAYDHYSARVDERHFERLLDFFGNLDAPL